MDNFRKQIPNLGLNNLETNRHDPQNFITNLEIPAPTPYMSYIFQPFRKREIKEKEKQIESGMFVG